MHSALQQAVPQVLHPPCGETPSLVLNLALMHMMAPIVVFGKESELSVFLHITHNYTKLYQTLRKFLFQAEKVQPMQLLFLQ